MQAVVAVALALGVAYWTGNAGIGAVAALLVGISPTRLRCFRR